MELSGTVEIPQEVADIFNAPSDDEEFFGFHDPVPIETESLEGSCDSFDSMDSGEKTCRLQSRYITEELRKIFTEETESDSEDFEGFMPSETELTESEVSDEESRQDILLSDKEEESEIPPKRSSFGLQVAFRFPIKTVNKTAVGTMKRDEPSYSKPGQKTSKPQTFGNRKSSKKRKKTSDSEEEGSEMEEETSSALLKRAMNIKENKAMLAQLFAELNSMPELFPMKMRNTTPSKQKKTPRKVFSEGGQIERRTNPTRSARPPENFALENFTMSAVRFAEHLGRCRRRNLLKRTLNEDEREEHRRRRSSKYSHVRPVEDITDEELENIAITVKDKIYDKILGSTCHQCRQKTIDTKTMCRNAGCGGVRGQFCGPCLRNRYGEDVKAALLDADWICPPCRGICNCSYCRKRDGRCATGMLIHLAKFYGYDNVKEYLESLQKQLVED
ncbi:cell division cycle-associated 7-like protein isoform X2 [Microcaecilia unicolor]|uniref:Cell division cycle-associated 7-like protein isoform X2 n=1 Tax=Microcaecilia unicolor TaxID=1415580 RepID=A0A6P7XXA9_9AMPH|nr:cell division cycle-associated 7-like protein isoform X2 [Microcaecilia unicolor]